MNFKVGDRVRFLNDVGEGEIVKVFDENKIIVMGNDGFEIPMREKDLLLVKKFASEYLDNKTNENANSYTPRQQVVNKVKFIPEEEIEDEEIDAEDEADLTLYENTETSLVIGFVPTLSENILKSLINAYLINDSNYSICFVVGALEGNEIVKKIASGILEANTKVHIASYDQTGISQLKHVQVQAMWFGNERFIIKSPLNETVNLVNENFYRAKEYVENDYFEEKAKVFVVGKMHLADIIKEKIENADLGHIVFEKEKIKKVNKPDDASKPEKDNPEEVDLHIHEIVDDYQGLSNGEIIRIQLNRFETSLEGAILNKQQKIVFIHGVGEGKLKYELRKLLDTKYADLKYQDASFKEYGYGATMVFIK